MKAIICLALWSLCLISKSEANDFSSFLTANASLAVVIDAEYMQKKGLDIFASIQKTIEDIAREYLKNGGLNVRYFTWSSVRLKKDFIAAVTVTDCAKTWRFFESAQINSILLLAITEAECPRLPEDKAIMIPLIERGAEIPQMLLDIRVQQVLQWRTSVLIFDKAIDERSTQILMSLVQESTRSMLKPISIYVYQVLNDTTYKSTLLSIEKILLNFINKKNNRFVVLLSSVNHIMEVAAKLNMFNVYNQWLFFLPKGMYSHDIPGLADIITEGANVAFAVNKTREDCKESIACSVTEIVKGFILALSKVIIEEGALYGQISDEEWEAIRLTKEERQLEILNFIKNFLVHESKCSGCPKWSFKSMLTWGNDRNQTNTQGTSTDILLTNSGNWSPMFGYVSKDVLFPHFDHKFRNIDLNVLTYNNPPWQIITKDENTNIVQYSGIVIDILKELSIKLNFSYNIVDATRETKKVMNDGKIQTALGSLTYLMHSKILEHLTKKKFFIVAAGSTAIDEDYNSFHYTVPISIQDYSFLTKKPDEVSRMYLFAAPFTTTTWISLIVAIIVTAPVLYLINKYGPVKELRTAGLCEMKNCFWYIYGALLQQGGLYLPKADSGRMVIGVWWTIVIVLVTTYCGNLVAFLTFPKFQPGVTYLSEIFSHNDITTFGLRNGTFFEKYASNSTRSDFRKYMETVTFYDDANGEDIPAVQTGKRINIDWKINLQLTIQKYFDQSKKCQLVLGKENFVDEQISLIVPSESPYLQLINDQIIRLHQMGFIHRWHQQYLPANNKCNLRSLTRQISNHKVNMNDMQGCFLILLFGFTIAVIFTVGEIWIHHVRSARRRRKSSFLQ